MNENFTLGTRLCPSCANSILEDAAKCPYCKTDLAVDDAPEWLTRDGPSAEPRSGSQREKRTAVFSKLMWPAVMLIVALTGLFAAGYEFFQSKHGDLKQLQAKDQIIQAQERQLSQIRQELSENSAQLAETRKKLEASQQELAATQQRLASSAREAERLAAARTMAVRNAAARAPNASPPRPVPNRTVQPGVYETTQPTSVHEDPSSASRVIAQIGKGTRINVVGAAGSWLEVRSKRGNPPGYVKSDDARQIARVN